jgi:hypothetical protein
MPLNDAKASLKRTSFLLVVSLLLGCGGGGGDNGPNGNVTAANAGPDQSVVVGSVVTLDGSKSTGANGSLITYQWSMFSRPAGSGAALSSATVVNPTFTADLAGSYVLNLVVNDGKVNSAPATVTITASVANAAPVADAGTPQSVTTGSVVTLDGSASSDANGDPLAYSWAFTSRPAGSSAALSSATVVNPTFTADLAGAYVLNLVVNDGEVNSAPATVTITASGAAPEVTTLSASAGPTVTLNGIVTANGLATNAWFEWGTDFTLTTSTSTSIQPVGSGSTSVAVDAALTGLISGTTYYYRVAASNSLGTTRGEIVLWVSFFQ